MEHQLCVQRTVSHVHVNMPSPRPPHHGGPSYAVEVVQEPLGVVDGGAEDRVWLQPLPVQVCSIQSTAVTGGRGRGREGEGGREKGWKER